MKWITRERPKTDRIACPWVIRRFIDPEAEFIYVPNEQVLAVAEQTGGHSFDAAGAEYDRRLLDRATFVYDALYAWCEREIR